MKYAGKTWCALAGVTALTFGTIGFTTTAEAAEADQVTITVAAISDFHGHLENAAQLKAALNTVEEANPNFLFVANGDSVGGSAFVSSIAKDTPTMEILGAMGLDLTGIGNHEFDGGTADFLNRIVPTSAQAGFPYTQASLDGIDPAVVPPFIIKEVAGVSIGFVSGVTDELDTLVSPAGIAGSTIKNPETSIDQVAAQLKDGNLENGEADIVVALDHANNAKATTIGENVDAVVAGHTHQEAEVTTASGAPVIEPGSYGEAYATFTFVFDTETDELVGDVKSALVKVNTGERNDDGTLPEDVPADADIEALYQAAAENAKKLGAEPVATINGSANRGTNDGTDLGANRGTEFPESNLNAEAFHAYAEGEGFGADFGVQNPGGVRAELDPNKDGKVTFEESFTAMPFGNSFATVDLTGDQVYTMFEQQWARETGADRPILRLGLSKNIFYTYDPEAELDHHITGIYLDGKLIDRTATYTVTSNAFLLAGGDGFTVFAEGKNYRDTGIIDLDAFNAYLQKNEPVTPDYSQHSIGVTGTLKAGEEATLKLASLATTSDEPKPENVDVYLNGEKVATAPVDTTVTPNLDETGQATVKFQVPADAPKTSQLRLVATPTDVTFTVTVENGVDTPTPNPSDDAGQDDQDNNDTDHGDKDDTDDSGTHDGGYAYDPNWDSDFDGYGHKGHGAGGAGNQGAGAGNNGGAANQGAGNNGGAANQSAGNKGGLTTAGGAGNQGAGAGNNNGAGNNGGSTTQGANASKERVSNGQQLAITGAKIATPLVASLLMLVAGGTALALRRRTH